MVGRDEVRAIERYCGQVDIDYAFSVALTLSESPAFHSSALGTRTAGSGAEHAASLWLEAQMLDLGLSEVERVPVSVDRWEFKSAWLRLESGLEMTLHAYASGGTAPDGLWAEVVFVGRGVAEDYRDRDVHGKIVLVEVDQRADWWVAYPMLEAALHGAAAILCANVSGFSEVNEDALNAQDLCAPVSIPCLSISVSDARRLREAMVQGGTWARLSVDNVVEPGGVSYNVVGRIPGRRCDEMILIGAHYDMYFKGFQDNCCAVGLVLAMAKALLASGYVPERDLVFCLHGAEEWGAIGSSFDWMTGAWRMIHEARPEWAGKTLAFFNFELPAYAFDDEAYAMSSPELYSVIRRFVREHPGAPRPEGCYPCGVRTEGSHIHTYSDDFTYHCAGVPSLCNAIVLPFDRKRAYPFFYERYHSQLDDASTFDPDVLRFHAKHYGSMLIAVDHAPALLLDFRGQHARMKAVADSEAFGWAGADVGDYREALDRLAHAAQAAYAQGEAINERYAKALDSGDGAAIEAIWTQAQAYNQDMLAAFRLAQDGLLALSYEQPIVPHMAQTANLRLLRPLIACLEAGDYAEALEAYACALNGGFEWYHRHFSQATTDTAHAVIRWPERQDRQFWGQNKTVPFADVERATRLLALSAMAPLTAHERAEILAVYRAAYEEQLARLRGTLKTETQALWALCSRLLAYSAS